jgi:pimeloyl-ACP methyl ester carboxylesterase
MIDVGNVPVFEKGIKNHSTRILKDCGHVPMVECPEETALYFDEFIRSVK